MILLAMVVIFTVNYLDKDEENVQAYSKVFKKGPIKYQEEYCYDECSSNLTFTMKGINFIFYQNNPFYDEVKSSLEQSEYITIWYDPVNDNVIYQVMVKRTITAPFEKLFSIENFDSAFIAILPLLMVFIALGRIENRTKR